MNMRVAAYRSQITIFLLVGLMVGTDLAIVSPPAQAQSLLDKIGKLVSPPTRRGTASGRSRGGAIRGNCKAGIADEKPASRSQSAMPKSGGTHDLVALIPKDNLGSTVAANPTFWFYIPTFWFVPTTTTAPSAPLTQVKVGQFMLTDDRGEWMFQQPISVQLPERSGLAQFKLPEDQAFWKSGKSLEVGKRYNWFFAIVCDTKQPAKNPSVRGWVERVAPPAKLEAQLAKVPAAEQYMVYVENGDWHESLRLLAENRQSAKPGWEALLKQLDLSQHVDAPITVLEPVK
jgi:hypothetical protein